MVTNSQGMDGLEYLLRLRRLEADAILDIIRAIFNPDLKRSSISIIVRNTFNTHLQCTKMFLMMDNEGKWEEEYLWHFDESTEEIRNAILHTTFSRQVSAENDPLLFSWGASHIIPIFIRSVPKAYFVLQMPHKPSSYIEWENIFIETVGHIVYQAIQNQLQIKQKLQQQKTKQELSVAEKIQKQLLISNFVPFLPLDIYALNIPFSEVGGDYYDIMQTPNGVFVCIADISGKGIAAAIVMSNVQANLRALCSQHDDPSVIITSLNRILFETLKGEKFVSLFLAKISFSHQTMSYINAGHNFPYFISGGTPLKLESNTTILGAFETIEAESICLPIKPEDLLFLYTDGYVEQPNEQGEYQDEATIEQLIASNAQDTAEMLVQKVLSHHMFFSKNAEIIDDVTFLVLKMPQV